MGYKFSSRKLFAVSKDVKDEHKLYSFYDLGVLNLKFLKHTGMCVINGITYFEFTFNNKYIFKNDCLGFAECLVSDKFKIVSKTTPKIDKSARKCAYVEKYSGKKFGFNYNQNIEIATNYFSDQSVLNNDADAEINTGEAYAIVNIDYYEQQQYIEAVPYHIAYVLFKDGDSNITMEADAGQEDRTDPVFDIYCQKDHFHTRWAVEHKLFDREQYQNTNANTIILVKACSK